VTLGVCVCLRRAAAACHISLGGEGNALYPVLTSYQLLLYQPKPIHCSYNLSIIAVFIEYLRQFLIDLHQIYRHSSVPKKHVSVHFLCLSAQAVSEHGAAATFFVMLWIARSSESLDCLTLA